MAKQRHSGLIAIEQIMADTTRSYGAKMEAIRLILESARKAERHLSVQLGIDLAKHMAANGYVADGRTLKEHFEERDRDTARRDDELEPECAECGGTDGEHDAGCMAIE